MTLEDTHTHTHTHTPSLSGILPTPDKQHESSCYFICGIVFLTRWLFILWTDVTSTRPRFPQSSVIHVFLTVCVCVCVSSWRTNMHTCTHRKTHLWKAFRSRLSECSSISRYLSDDFHYFIHLWWFSSCTPPSAVLFFLCSSDRSGFLYLPGNFTTASPSNSLPSTYRWDVFYYNAAKPL